MPHQVPSSRCAVLALVLIGGCDTALPEPTPQPTRTAVTAMPDELPPLYQLLFQLPTLSIESAEQQRVRMLVWLRTLRFEHHQLDRLSGLCDWIDRSRATMRSHEARIEAQWGEQERALYGELWDELGTGRSLADPALEVHTRKLGALLAGDQREEQLLGFRLGIFRSLQRETSRFQATLDKEQRKLLPSALFFLRHRLDPLGTPDEYSALVGSPLRPGLASTLVWDDSRSGPEALMKIWADNPYQLDGVFGSAERDVILILAVMEPGLEEAIEMAHDLLRRVGHDPATAFR